ncbi:minor capsid protein [[Clostridium] innocuum]|nr:minor capsid protein [[Clostridium] innocuum]MCR0469690.1 minor capsid protein [[Clostridium] innocuum]MCR0478188.1 minor capsid protein [[Clostridium] innocuum]
MAKSKLYQNSEYWENRIAKETWRTYNNVEEQNRDLLRMYEKTSSSIKRELYALAEEAEKTRELTRTQQYRFNKLLGQQGAIFQEIEKLGTSIEKSQTSRMKTAGRAVYKNVMESLGIDNFSFPNKKEMEQMLRSPWHGSFFSERLWNDMGVLERNMNGVINNFIATGKTVTETAVQLSNVMQKSFNVAHRLVRTETINYMNRSALRGYKDAGVKKVQWWAAEDERTCKICGANHEKEYDIDKAPILPCHTGCRCTWLPVLDDETPKLTEAENAAIVKYVSPDAYVLNDKLRNGYDLSESDKKWINSLDKALYKIPAIQGVVNRSLNFLHDEDRKKFIEMHEVGNKVKYKEYVSSSMNEVYNEDGEVQITIYSKNGRDIRSVNPEENEILFMRDTEFESVNIEKLNGKTYIDLVEVDKNEQ